jgi:hypothetical protein
LGGMMGPGHESSGKATRLKFNGRLLRVLHGGRLYPGYMALYFPQNPNNYSGWFL